MILYVYTIQQSNNSQETYQRYFMAAQRCQNQLSSIAEDVSLTARYCLILEELRAEAMRQTEHSTALQQHVSMQSTQPLDMVASGTDMDGVLIDQVAEPIQGLMELANGGELGPFEASPDDEVADMTGWGQFDSMVSTDKWLMTVCPIIAKLMTNYCEQVMSGLGGFDNLIDGFQLPL